MQKRKFNRIKVIAFIGVIISMLLAIIPDVIVAFGYEIFSSSLMLILETLSFVVLTISLRLIAYVWDEKYEQKSKEKESIKNTL